MYSGVKRRINALVIDVKVGLTEYDIEFLDLIADTGKEVIILLNKTDKLKQGILYKQTKKIQEQLGEKESIVQFSAIKKKGVDKF